MNKNSIIGIIAIVAIALMAGIWIGSEKDIAVMELDSITSSISQKTSSLRTKVQEAVTTDDVEIKEEATEEISE